MMNPTLKGFIQKEFRQTLRDPRMRFFLFIVPIIQMTLFGLALSNEVKHIRIAAAFDAKDSVMRNIYEQSLQGEWFIPAKTTHIDPYEMIHSGEADVVVIPPPGGLTKALGRKEAPLQLLVDATNATQANAVENYLSSIINKVVRHDLNLKDPESPIHFDVRILYNPSLDTSIFMVPGVLCMLMVMSSLTLCMSAITREKETGTFEMLVSAPVKAYEILLGKTIPYVILGMCNMPVTLAVAIFVFGVPMRGSFLLLVISAFFFVCTCVSLGTLISTLCKNQQQANLASFLFMFPAIMFSGLLFPLENMPSLLRTLAHIDPLSHYLSILRNIMLKGGDLQFVGMHVGYLFIIAIVAGAFSYSRFKTTLA
jgi:ABC-2 type transport system permease protein